MIAVDTNILVYAHREDAPWHDTAYAKIGEVAEDARLGRFLGRALMNF